MTGLIVKDFLVMRKSIKTYILFLLFYFVMAALGIFPISFITAMVQIIIMMLPLSAFSYDELSKWDRYAFSLPLSRRAVAGARYLFALILTLFAALFGLVFQWGIFWVYVGVFMEQAAKLGAGVRRFRSRGWIVDVTMAGRNEKRN